MIFKVREKKKLFSSQEAEEKLFSDIRLNYQLKDITTVDHIVEIFETEGYLSFVYRYLEGMDLC